MNVKNIGHAIESASNQEYSIRQYWGTCSNLVCPKCGGTLHLISLCANYNMALYRGKAQVCFTANDVAHMAQGGTTCGFYRKCIVMG